MAQHTGRYAVVWPRGTKAIQPRQLAARLPTLQGKTIAQLWDYIFRGDEIFPLLEEGLSARFPDITFVRYDTFGSTHGGEEHRVLAALPAKLRQYGVEAVISGMAC